MGPPVYSRLAQLVEQWTVNPCVAGPSPATGARLWGCSSVGRASALQAEGRQFESDQLHHNL